jgi:hypothetical protein
MRDGQSVTVAPPWRIGKTTGSVVRIHGMSAPPVDTREGQIARRKPCLLLTGAAVKRTRVYDLDGSVLTCDLEYQGLPLRKHFSEYAERA